MFAVSLLYIDYVTKVFLFILSYIYFLLPHNYYYYYYYY